MSFNTVSSVQLLAKKFLHFTCTYRIITDEEKNNFDKNVDCIGDYYQEGVYINSLETTVRMKTTVSGWRQNCPETFHQFHTQ